MINIFWWGNSLFWCTCSGTCLISKLHSQVGPPFSLPLMYSCIPNCLASHNHSKVINLTSKTIIFKFFKSLQETLPSVHLLVRRTMLLVV